MKKLRVLGVLMLSFLLVFGIVACSSNDTEPKQENTQESTNTENVATETEEAPVPEGPKEIVVAGSWLGSDADPANGWNGWSLMRTASGENLATLNENMELVPQLADSWEVVDDLTWKFHIRQGVKFSNGKDLTPEAVKKSLERVISKDDRAAANAKMESITVDGEYVVFKTTEPYGSLANNLTEPLFIIIDTDMDDEIIAKTPVTTAPYKITEYNPKVDMKLVANEYYWGDKPALDGFIFKMIKDDATRTLAMQSGEIQVAQRLDGVSIKTLQDTGNFDIKEVPSLRVNYLGFNHENEILKDINVRKAISSAINRESIAKLLNSVPVGAIFPPSAGYGYDQLDLEKYDFELAKKLLADSGYADNDGDGYVEKNGKKLSFVLPISSKSSSLAEIIQAQLKEVGIELKIELKENAYELLGEGKFDIFLTNYVTATTGDSKRFLEQNYSTNGTDNFGHYSNPKFDAIVEELVSEFDTEKRVELSIKAQQIVNDDVANVFIISPKSNVVSAKNITGTTVSPIDYYFMTGNVGVE